MVECLDLRPDQPRPQGAFSLALEVGREKGYATRKLRPPNIESGFTPAVEVISPS